MSDADDTDTPEMLAAEYVLGTLASNEREQAQNLIANDPAFAELVRGWEHRLGQLHAMEASVEPPPETWSRIQARLEGVEPSGAMLLPHPDQAARIAAEGNVVDLRKRLGRWRPDAAGPGGGGRGSCRTPPGGGGWRRGAPSSTCASGPAAGARPRGAWPRSPPCFWPSW